MRLNLADHFSEGDDGCGSGPKSRIPQVQKMDFAFGKCFYCGNFLRGESALGTNQKCERLIAGGDVRFQPLFPIHIAED